MLNFMKRYLRNRGRVSFAVRLILASSFVFMLWCGVSCVKMDNEFGNSMLPPSQGMATRIDSSLLVTTTLFKLDSVRTNNTSSIVAVGSFIDPLVGRTTSMIFTDFIPTWPKDFQKKGYFGPSPEADSVFMTFDFVGARGDTTTDIEIEVYRVLSRTFPLDSLFYTTFDMEPWLVGVEPILRFRQRGVGIVQHALPIEFGRELLDVGVEPKEGPYTNDEKFIDKFRGFYMRSSVADAANPGQMLNLNLAGSFVRVYYHNDRTSKADTTAMKYYFKSQAATRNVSFEMVRHDYSFADVMAGGVDVDDIGSGMEVRQCFAQGMGGVGTYVTMPRHGVEQLIARVREEGYSRIALHKAELVFEMVTKSVFNYNQSASKLGLYYDFIKSDFIPDYNPLTEKEGVTSYFGGSLNRGVGVYRMDITSYFQGFLSEVSSSFPTGDSSASSTASGTSGTGGTGSVDDIYVGSVKSDKLQLLPFYSGNLLITRTQMFGSAAEEGLRPRLVLTYTMIR